MDSTTRGTALPISPPISRRTWLAWGAAGIATPWLAGCGGGDATPPLHDTIAWGQQAIEQAMQRSQTRAASVALLHGQRIVWQQGFGTQDVAGLRPTTEQTVFNIGSVSKVVAALAVMVLVDRDQVQLDTPVTRYLPRFRMRSPEYTAITLRHLLSHSSGLPGTHLHNAVALAPLIGYAKELEASLADIHLKHAPGALAVYCNDGFTLVERVVEQVTSLPYARFVQTQLLQPMGMAHSDFPLQPPPAGSMVEVDVDGVPQHEYVMLHASGGLRSTPGDMMKLAAMLLQQGSLEGRRIISPERVADMAQDQGSRVGLNLTPDWRWGLGWDRVRHQGLDAVGALAWQKNGATVFFSTDFFVLPQAQMALLVTGNSTAFNPGALAESIVLRALHESGQLAQLPKPLTRPLPPVATEIPPALEPLLGIYAHHEAPYKVALGTQAQQLDLWVWSAQTQSWQAKTRGLRLRADGWWYPDAHPHTPSYRWQEADGKRYLLTRQSSENSHYSTTMPLAQQIHPAATPLPAHWAALRGSTWMMSNEDPQSVLYIEPPTPITLAEHPELPGYLFWDNSQFLQPLPDGNAAMAVQVPLNAGRDLLELMLLEQDGSQWLYTSGWRYQRLS